MNRKNLNSFNAIKSVEHFLTINEASLANKPPIVDVHIKLKTAISEIQANEQIQAADTSIETTLRGQSKKEVIAATLRVAAALLAVAAATSDTRLRMLADVSKTDLTRMRENNLSTKIKNIYQAAVDIAPELVMWGVSREDIESLDACNNKFMQKKPENRIIKIVGGQAKLQVNTKIAETSALIRNTLDLLMLPFKTINPTLHGEYVIARTIIHTAATHRRKKNEKKDENPAPAE